MKYKVSWQEIHQCTVEADYEDEAKDIAFEISAQKNTCVDTPQETVIVEEVEE